MKKLSVVFLFLLFCAVSGAQDTHFSQLIPNSGTLFSTPSLLKNSFLYANVGYRSQWKSGLGNGFNTMVVDVEGSMFDDKLNAGIYCINDRSGDGKFSHLSVNLPVSYKLAISRESNLMVGITMGWLQNSVVPGNFTWTSQFNGSVIDNSITSGETFSQIKVNAWDVSCGLRYSFTGDGFLFNIAGGLSHVNQPKLSFYNDKNEFLPRKISGMLNFVKLKNGFSSLNVSHFFFYQNAQIENYTNVEYLFNIGMDSKYTGLNKSSQVGFIVGLRWGDAIVVGAVFDLMTRYRIGLSYDLTVMGPAGTNSKKGGPELSLTYHPQKSGKSNKKFF